MFYAFQIVSTVISTLVARKSLVATVFAAWDGLLWWSQLFCKRNTSGRRSSWSALKSALEECDRFSSLSSPAGWLSSPDL